MSRTPNGAASSTKAAARSESTTLPMRSSVERSARESRDTKTIDTMKKEAILMPSGRPWMLSSRV